MRDAQPRLITAISKRCFSQIAAQYRDLAEQIADPEQWQAKRDGRPK
jgi:hypothetical protein